MASCSLATESAHFSLESNCSGILSSISFQPASSSVNTTPGPLAVSNLCAQVICLTGPSSDMQSTRKNVKNDNSKRGGKKSINTVPGSSSKKIADESGGSSNKTLESKIMTRRSADKLERAATSSDIKMDVAEEDGAVKSNRRGLKRTSKELNVQDENHKEVRVLGEPEKKRKLRSNSLEETPQKVPGTAFKICASCGTVADKTKAKKCRQCKKFFFNHWAKRCRIPPCPKCHFSRKAKSGEPVPVVCEKCGSQLSLNHLEDGSDVSKADSSSTDLDSSVSSKACKEDDDSLDAVDRRDSKSDSLSLPSAISTPLVSPDELGSFKMPEEQGSSFTDASMTQDPSERSSLAVPVVDNHDDEVEVFLQEKAESIALNRDGSVTGAPESDEDERLHERHHEDPGHLLMDFGDLEDCTKYCMKGDLGEAPEEAAGDLGEAPEEAAGEHRKVSEKLAGELKEALEKAKKDVQKMTEVGDEMAAGGQEMITRGQEMAPQEQEMTAGEQEMSAGGQEMSAGGQEVSAGGQEVSAEGQDVSGGTREVSARGREVSAGGQEVSARGQEVLAGERDKVPNLPAAKEIGQDNDIYLPAAKEIGQDNDIAVSQSPPEVNQCVSKNPTITVCSDASGRLVTTLASDCVVSSTAALADCVSDTVSCPASSDIASTSSHQLLLSTHFSNVASADDTATPTSSDCPASVSTNVSCCSDDDISSGRTTIKTCATNMIDKSLEEHFERSLIGLEARHTPSGNLSSALSKSRRESLGSEEEKEKGEDRIEEVATVVKVDRLGQGGWSGALGSVSICTMDKPIDPAMFGSGLLPHTISPPTEAGQVTLPGHAYSSSHAVVIPSFLSSQAGSTLSISLPSPLPLSVMSPSVFPLLPTSTLTSSQMLFQHPATMPSIPPPLPISPPATAPARYPFTSTVFTPQSTCLQMSTPTMQFISSTQANGTGTKPSKLPVITSAHSERASKLNVSPPSTMFPLPSPLSGTTPISGCSRSYPEALPEVFIVEKNSTKAMYSANPLGTGHGENRLPLTLPNSAGISHASARTGQAQGTNQNQGNDQSGNQARPDSQESKVMPVMPKLESKSLATAVGQPPSLVSIGASGMVTISRSYTLPQAPRVSIAVAPPPLQNIKDGLVTKSSLSPLQSPMTGIAPIKGEVTSKSSLPNVAISGVMGAGKSGSIPPPLFSTNSLGDSRVDALQGIERLTSSGTVSIDIASATKPHLVNHEAASSGEQKSSSIPSSQVSGTIDKIRLSSTTGRGSVENHQKSAENISPLPRSDAGVGGGRTEVPATSFQKLDLLHSPLSANKIRVTLLKDNSDSGSDHVPPVSSPTPLSPLFPSSSTRLITKVYEFPRHMSSCIGGPIVSSSLATPMLSSASITACPSPISLYGPPAVAPSGISIPCRVTSPVSLSSFQASFTSSTTLPPLASSHGIPMAKVERSVSPQLATVANSLALKWANASSESGTSVSDRMHGDSGSFSFGNGVAFSFTQEQMSFSHCTGSEEEGSARTKGLGGQKRRDLSTIAMEMQRRISNVLATKTPLPEESHHQARLSTSLPASSPSQMGGPSKMNSYRRILPNISKYPQNSPPITVPSANPLSTCTVTTTATTAAVSSATLTSNSGGTSQPASSSSSIRSTSPSYSHVRTPGVVTVQVCSSIPATLSLSSIITPKITQAECLGGGSGGTVSSPSDASISSDYRLPTPTSSAFSSLVKHRGGIGGGGGVMVTPLSPSVLPPGRTVAQIVTSSIANKDVS